MTDATTEFFEELDRRDHEPLLAKVSATARFELSHDGATDHWLVAVDRGNLTVSHHDGPADLMLRTERKLFDGMATGQVNAVAALLRGALVVEGDWELMVLIQRLFPGPPRARQEPTTTTTSKREKR